MVSTKMMLVLIAQYAVICVLALCEGNHPRAMYFFSAGLISVSVLWGMS